MAFPSAITGGQTPGNPARSTAKGRLNLVYFVSRTHGAAALAQSTASSHQLVPVPILNSFNITPKLSAETIQQFGSLDAALTVPDYADCEVAFDIMDTDLFQVYAAIMDLPPNTTAFTIMPDMLLKSEFTAFGNQFHEVTGSIYESFVVAQISLTSYAMTQTPDKSMKVSFKGTGTIMRRAVGMAVDYYRFVNNGVAYATPYDVTLTAGTTGALNNTAATNLLPPGIPVFASGTYSNYQLTLYNGQPTTNGFSISGSTFTVASSGLPTDIWETFIGVSGTPTGNVN